MGQVGNVLDFSRQGMFRTLTSALVERFKFARQAGITFGGLRDEYEIFGYDRDITLKQYRDEYARGGIAKRIVHAFPMATWRGSMELIEEEDNPEYTPFEQAWADLDKKFKLQSVFRRVDILAGLSHYSVLLIGAPGDLSTELPKGKPEKLLYFTPFPGGGSPISPTSASVNNLEFADATIESLELDPTNPRFGLPKAYNLRRIDVSNPAFNKPVHWSRIIHIAEGCVDNELFGTPTLEAVWNLLIDLRKVTGGGAEAFFQRANQGMNLNLDKEVDLDTEASTKLKDEVDEYMHKVSRVLKTRGMEVKMLGSDVADFANPADAILTQIAGTTSIPKRILTGSEMGELASSQDRDNWKDQINGRQDNYAGPYIVRPLADRLIAYGYLPSPKKGADAYSVVWPHIQTLTEQEKADGASKWFSMNSGPVPTFTVDEVRDKWYGMGPLTEEQLEREAELRQLMAPPAPAAPTAPGAPPSGDPEDIDTDGLVDALMDDDPEEGADADPEATPALKAAGGPGSGNFGHAGRPGEVGGSADGGGVPKDRASVARKIDMQSMPKGSTRLMLMDPEYGKLVLGVEVNDIDSDVGELTHSGVYSAATGSPKGFDEMLRGYIYAPTRNRSDGEIEIYDPKVMEGSLSSLTQDEKAMLHQFDSEAAQFAVDRLGATENTIYNGPASGLTGRNQKLGDQYPDLFPGKRADLDSKDASRVVFQRVTSKIRFKNEDNVSEITKTERGYEFGVRDFGEWVMPPDAEDGEEDGDYDWKVPSERTVKDLDRIVGSAMKSYPDTDIRWSDSEKGWIHFTVEPKKKPRALGGPGSGVVGHMTPGQPPALDARQQAQVDRYMPAVAAVVRKGGGSLKKSKQQVKAELEHKDEMAAASTMRKLQLSLKAKGFTPAVDKNEKPIEGQFVNKDGRKATMRMIGKKLSISITKKPAKKAEELKDAEGYKYSSMQVNMPPSIASRMLSFGEAIPDIELVDHGRETTPHVTVLYGLHTQSAADIYKVLDDVPGPVRVRLGELDYFEGDGYDVIVVRVESPDLVTLNERLRAELPYTNGYPDYQPHATIAYVQPGVGERYAGMKTFEGLGFETSSLVFSPKEGDDVVVDLGLRAAMASLIDEDSETVQVLSDAIAAGNMEVVAEMLRREEM